jgi:hypothetical protein
MRDEMSNIDESGITKVLDSNDLLEYISKWFHFLEMKPLLLVNRSFYQLFGPLYRLALSNHRVHATCIYFRYLTENGRYFSMMEKAVCFSCFVDRYMYNPIHGYLLLTNDDFTKNLFHRAADFHYFKNYIVNYDRIHNKIRPFLYIRNSENYTTKELLDLVRYRDGIIRNPKKLNKRYLQHLLRYPTCTKSKKMDLELIWESRRKKVL